MSDVNGLYAILSDLANKAGRKGKTKIKRDMGETQNVTLSNKVPIVATKLDDLSKGFGRTGGTVSVKGDVEGADVSTTMELSKREAAKFVFVVGSKTDSDNESERLAVACGAIVDAAKQREREEKERADALLLSLSALDSHNATYNHVERAALEKVALAVSKRVTAGEIDADGMAEAFRLAVEKAHPRPDGEGKPSKGKRKSGKDRADVVEQALADVIDSNGETQPAANGAAE